MKHWSNYVLIFLQLCSPGEPLVRRLPVPLIQQPIPESRDEWQSRVHHQLWRRLGRRLVQTQRRHRLQAWGQAGTEEIKGPSEGGGPSRDDGSDVAGIER